MSWIRVCPFCKESMSTDMKRFIKIKKISVLQFFKGVFQLEWKNNSTEEICCEKCAKIHTIKELWDILQYSKRTHVEEKEDEKEEG